MSKKVYNYDPPKHWGGGRGPHGDYNSTKEDFNAYLKDWDELNNALETITGLKVTAYDPGVNLTRIDERNNWSTIQFPMWFAKLLVERCYDSKWVDILKELKEFGEKLEAKPSVTSKKKRNDGPINDYLD